MEITVTRDEVKFFSGGSKKRKCMKCGRPRNHNGKSSNVFYCNDCKPAKFR